MQRVNREEFLNALEAVESGLSARDMIEQSSCFVFKDKKVYTFNEEIACTHDTKLKLHGAVHAAPLLAILRKLEDEELDLEQTDEYLKLKGRRKVSGIRMEAKVELQIDVVEQPTKWRALDKNFAEAVAMVQHCAGKDQSKWNLTCIHITPKWIEACDNNHLMRYRLKTHIERSTLVRKDSLICIRDLEMEEFSETPNWIHFRNQQGLVLSCRSGMEDEPYPSLKAMLKGDGKKTNLPKGLRSAVEKAAVFSSENANEDWVTVSLVPGTPGKLRIKGEGAFGYYTEAKSLSEYKGDELEFMIAPGLLNDILSKYDDCLVSQDKLKVRGERYTYVTSLRRPQTKENSE